MKIRFQYVVMYHKHDIKNPRCGHMVETTCFLFIYRFLRFSYHLKCGRMAQWDRGPLLPSPAALATKMPKGGNFLRFGLGVLVTPLRARYDICFCSF